MPTSFADAMRDLTETVREAAHARAGAVHAVRAHTHHQLDAFRADLKQAAQDMRDRLAADRQALAAATADRREAVRQSLDATRRTRAEAGADQRDQLTTNRAARRETVTGLLAAATDGRAAFAAECAAGAASWATVRNPR